MVEIICKPCAKAADLQKAKAGGADQHPIGCNCFCQHKPVKDGQINAMPNL